MALSKKAYFFSVTALMLIGFVTIIMASTRDPGYQRSAALDNERIGEAQAFIQGVEQDASTAAYVATYRSLLAAQSIIREQGPLSDPQGSIETMIMEGNYEGVNRPIMQGETLEDWTANLQPLAKAIRLELEITIEEVDVKQEDPWHVTTTAKMRIHVHDDYAQATWDQSFEASAAVPIEGLEDPLHTIGTDGRSSQTINRTQGPIGDLEELIANHLYIASEQGPGYLGRLAGSTEPSPNGIESLVNVERLSEVGVVEGGSIIDWQYFGTNEPDACQVPGLPSWALIGRAQAERYGVSCP